MVTLRSSHPAHTMFLPVTTGGPLRSPAVSTPGRPSPPRSAPTTCSRRSRRAGPRCSPPSRASPSQYGYGMVHTPLFEDLGVFQRMGEGTDVVTKEMYDFEDKGGRRIALRPEGTASVVRAFVEHRPIAPVEGVVRHAGVPVREAPEGPLPPAPPGGDRGAGRRRPRRRRRGHRPRRSLPAQRSAPSAYLLVVNSMGEPRGPGPLRRRAARVPRRRARRPRRGGPRQGRAQPACGCSTPSAARRRRPPPTPRGSPTCCPPKSADASTGSRRASARSASSSPSTPGSSGASTTTRTRCSSSRATRSTRPSPP